MAKLLVSGAKLQCTMGTSPASLTVLPTTKEDTDGNPAASVDDHQPMVNIPGFGMCQSMANPQVSAATSAAMGVLTPQPCVPVIPAPWSPGATKVTVHERPAVTDACKCNCQWGGSISVQNPGQTIVDVE